MRILIVWACCVAALVSYPSAATETGPPQKQPHEVKLDPKIPAAKRAQYRTVEPREWRNPWLDVNDRGFELRSRSSPEPKFVSLKDLRRVLTELPLSDWPYGRVVVVQSPGIGPADPEWWRAVRENIEGAQKVLKALGAEDWGWPA
jgi:hypothetical protein